MEFKISKQPTLADTKDFDQNGINWIIKIHTVLRVIFVVAKLFNISLMSAIAWIILAQLSDGLFYENDKDSSTFIKEYELGESESGYYNPMLTNLNKLVICWYFSFTTLSTTGFGDYYPISDIERFISAFIMLFGVAVFSFITANYIVIIQSMDQNEE